MRIVMLGASGNAGGTLAALLGPSLVTEDHLVLAGRSLQRLEGTRGRVATAAETELLDDLRSFGLEVTFS